MSEKVLCNDHPNSEMLLDARAGDIICTQCGVVVGERFVDVSTEWRRFNTEQSCKDPSRIGSAENPLLSGSDLSTSIEFRRGQPNPFGPKGKVMNAIDRQLSNAFKNISEIAERGNIPASITDSAKLIYKNSFETGKLKSKKLDAHSAAAIYIACRKNNVSRTFKEISAISRTNMKDIGKAYKNIIICSRPIDLSPVVNATEIVDRFVGNLILESQTEKIRLCALARKFVSVAVTLACCVGRSPVSIVAGCIYLACYQLKIPKTHKEVGDVCGAAESTVRQVERSLVPYGDVMLSNNPKEFEVNGFDSIDAKEDILG